MSFHKLLSLIILPFLCVMFIGNDIYRNLNQGITFHNSDNTNFYNITISAENLTCNEIETTTCLNARECGRIIPNLLTKCEIIIENYITKFFNIWNFWIEVLICTLLYIICVVVIFCLKSDSLNLLAIGYILIRLHIICLALWYMIIETTVINIILYSWIEMMFVMELISIFCILPENQRNKVFGFES